MDIAGLVKGASKGEGLGNKFLSHIREVDAIIHLVRCFESDKITHVNSKINPVEDLETIKTEIMLSDLDIIQKKLEKGKKKLLNDKEIKILEEKLNQLDNGEEILAKEEFEKKNISLFQLIFEKSKEVQIPKVFQDISTQRLISMNYLRGYKLLHFKNHPHNIRKKIAINMFKAWYFPFYNYGIIHGDPHLGNYSSDEKGNINLLDFGCIRIFKPSFVKGVIDLYYAIKNNNQELAVHAYQSWGFENISNDMIEILNIWAKFLYSPLMDN